MVRTASTTEKEKMLAGMVYDATTPELIAELQATREVLYEFNTLRPSETLRMKEILITLRFWWRRCWESQWVAV